MTDLLRVMTGSGAIDRLAVSLTTGATNRYVAMVRVTLPGV